MGTRLRLAGPGALALALALPACGGSEGGAEEGSVVLEQVVQRLFEQPGLVIEAPGEPTSGFREIVPALVTHRRELAAIGARRALAVAPGERVSIDLEVPPDAVLEFGVALDRSASGAGSDGMRFELLADGRALWSEVLDAGPRPHLNAWLGVRLPLAELAGRTVRLTFAADAGPAGDATGDLGGFSGAVLKRGTRIPRQRSGPGHPNLLLVLVDTLRADALGCAAERPRAGVSTPRVDRLAAEGFVFEQAYSAAPWTMPSVASIFTGKPVLAHGTVGSYQPRLLDEHETLAERLALEGLSTQAFVANPLICKEQNFDQGFQDLRQVLDARSDRLFAQAAEWIVSNGDWQWFAYVHAMDPHDPYTPPLEVAERLLADYSGPFPRADTGVLRELKERGLSGLGTGPSEGDVRHFRALYDAEVTALDASLEVFLARLEAQGRLEDTLVVLTSDHGEEFCEHGAFLHGHDLHEELVHVPLIFWRPGAIAAGRSDVPVSLVDLRGTVCGLLGLEDEVDGPSLFEVAAGAEGSPLLFFTNVFEADARIDGLRRGPWKVKHRVDRGTYELYDLGRDPGERSNLLAGLAPSDLDPEDARLEPLRELADELGRIEPPGRGQQELADPQAQEVLRALGYVE